MRPNLQGEDSPMAGDSWLACRAPEALRNGRSLVAAGAILGFFSALVPSGFAGYPGGAGLVGGIGVACVGSAALAPPTLPCRRRSPAHDP
jgi:hypothetical protein